jgi:uncharacterized protein YgiM (DUF1202 family)
MSRNLNRRRSIRLRLITAAASLAISTAPVVVFAQVSDDPALKEVENSKFSTSGVIMSNAVYVRCGPGDNYYPTLKLDKGAKVKVVGAKFDWLKIVPPEGSFCYVARLYVDRHGDGSVGRVNKNSINVRAGSALSALKIGILCELNQGEEVEILGEEQEYFKIKPPAKAYLYINKKFVEPDPDAKPVAQATPKPEAPKPEAPKPETTAANPGETKPEVKPEAPADATFGNPATPKPETAKGPDGAPATPLVGETPKPETVKPEAPKPETVKPEVTGGVPATPDTTGNSGTPTEAPKTDGSNVDGAKPVFPVPETPKPEAPKPEAPKPVKPALPKIDVSTPEAAEAAFDKAEREFQAARTQSLDQQPIESLVYQFQTISHSDALPESLRRITDSRLATLKVRAGAQTELAKARQAETDLKQKQMALQAEQQELMQRIAATSVKIYTAVGTLQSSSLQQGQGTLYRVTDPATGRTVCYIRSNDPKTVEMLGQFVGIKGALKDESRLGARVITPTEVTACDPAKVHTTIMAQIIPPSMSPHEPVEAKTDPQPQ